MTFAKDKIRVKMRRKSWRPLTLGVKSFMLYNKTWVYKREKQ